MIVTVPNECKVIENGFGWVTEEQGEKHRDTLETKQAVQFYPPFVLKIPTFHVF